jgi:hypothetical protein
MSAGPENCGRPVIIQSSSFARKVRRAINVHPTNGADIAVKSSGRNGLLLPTVQDSGGHLSFRMGGSGRRISAGAI